MIYLSASSIKDFISCERKYWYRRYASDRGETSEAAERGTIVHKAIELHWNEPDKGLAYADVYGDSKARQLTFSFYDKFYGFVGKNDLIEEKFKINYSKGVKIVGVFDRVTPTGIIYDWKTNRSLPRTLDNDPQFMLYHHAYSKLYGKAPAAVYFASLTAGRLVKFKYNQELFSILYNEVIPDMLEHIKEKKFNPTGLYRYTTCKFCFYKSHCHDALGLEEYNELDRKKFNFG